MKRKYKILVHVFFWIYIINQVLFPYYIQKVTEEFYYKDIIIYLFVGLITFYSIYFSLSFLFFLKNKWISVILGLSLLTILVFTRVGIEFVFWKYISPMKDGKPILVDNPWIFNSVRLVIINAIYAVLIKLAIDWYEAQKLKTELINRNQASELALLRSQVNPHFLFNTLNNIYSLVYKKSEDAPEAVMKLSSIMRYMLYDATSDKVLLEKEIEYLKSFIELQKLRLRQQDFVEINIHGVVNGRTIAPMLLIPFVENAFKHSSKNAPNPGIRINLIIEPQQIQFIVTNHIRKSSETAGDPSGGIGLHNIQRRLDLLYPGKHSLVITEDQDIFTVKLVIEN
jgi:two-component system, LytTR family, sensor kinase